MNERMLAFERGRYRLVSIVRGNVYVHHATIERGRTDAGSTVHTFTGCTASRSVAFNAPAFECPDDEVVAALAHLRELRELGVLDLHYSALTRRSATLGGTAAGPIRSLSVWAVTGTARTGAGHVVPIGWSGRGEGLATLHSARGRLLSELGAAATAAPVVPGIFAVVLAPAAAAVVVHEVGHLTEVAPEGPALAPLGTRLGSELVTIADDPLADGPGRYDYDDENVRAFAATTVVQCGIVVNHLHSAATARDAMTLSTPNSRAASAWHPAIPRMSNLHCRAGRVSEADLIRAVGEGLYVHRLADGVGSGGRIAARLVLAERIRGGVRAGEYHAGGRVEESIGVLRRVVGVADNAAFSDNAMCGRYGQLLFNVGTSSPSLALSGFRVVA
ncbi:MAG: hypothetical protein KIT31_14345 [Deltaproteobacteria bacterium]|nr:hypothetical protein [Deltaproteobacteria bacterium]